MPVTTAQTSDVACPSKIASADALESTLNLVKSRASRAFCDRCQLPKALRQSLV
jgi:hypothetical protein